MSFEAMMLTMNIKPKKEMTFGDLITAADVLWGADQAERMVRWATIARLVVFREPPRVLIRAAKGRSA
jgi:hypothetical protein